jgi:hypothetical protein
MPRSQKRGKSPTRKRGNEPLDCVSLCQGEVEHLPYVVIGERVAPSPMCARSTVASSGWRVAIG